MGSFIIILSLRKFD